MDYNELYHHGVKGMKWGVRRYEYEVGRVRRQAKRGNWSEDARTAAEIRTKRNINKMSNAELRKLNERIQLERQYKQLNPGALSKGVKYVGQAAAIMGTAISFYNNSKTVTSLGKKFVENAPAMTLTAMATLSTTYAKLRGVSF